MNRWRPLYTLLILLGLLAGGLALAGGALLAIRFATLESKPKPSEPAVERDASKSESNAVVAPTDAEPDGEAASQPQPGTTAQVVAPASSSDPSAPEERRFSGDASDVAAKPAASAAPAARSPRELTPLERATGSFFTPVPLEPLLRPELVEIVVPEVPGGSAIWGATGRDSRGHVWYGISAQGIDAASAFLMEMDPATGASTNRGDVVSQLREAVLLRSGEQQAKIHSRVVEAADGRLYFASFDEQGEDAESSQLPTWGGHLWRVAPGSTRWEHLAATSEALIAVGTAGQWVYALGYFDHVLYQYNIRTGELRSVRVGSVDGHVSRNLLVDSRGHAYVPRLRGAEGLGGPPQALLVEFDTQLKEVAATPLLHYLDPEKAPANSHGIVGLCHLADGSLAMVTDVGYLYRISPSGAGRAAVEPMGWMHPSGASYCPSLFTFSGERYLLGLGRREKGPYQWLVYDVTTRTAEARDLIIVDFFDPPRQEILLYGSLTRDFSGRFYVAGRYRWKEELRPLLMRIDPEATALTPP